MKHYTLIASPLNEEGLWLAEIPEVKCCKTQGKDLLEVIQRAKELKEAIDTINGLQFLEEEQTICSDISEVLGIIEEFDIVDDRGNKAFRRHLGIIMTHLCLEIPTLSIGPWTIQCKSMKRQLDNAPKWDGWKDKWNGNEETA